MTAPADTALEDAIRHLRGPVHGTLMTVRGMCTDGVVHEEIDRKIVEVDDYVYEVLDLLDEH